MGLMVAGLGAEEVAAFHRDGWVVARQLLPPATVQLLSAPFAHPVHDPTLSRPEAGWPAD